MFRRIVVPMAVVFIAACGPVGPVEACRTSADCSGILVCEMELCVMPVDAGRSAVDAGHLEVDSGVVVEPDAGTVADSGTVTVDSGVIDSGVVDSGVADAGVVAVDAGGDAGVDAGVDAGPSCTPSVELCNGRDDDCDGQIDENAVVTALDGGTIEFDGGFALPSGMCVVGVGVCQHSGMTTCSAGAFGCSQMASSPGVERCNGLDDDCDGMTDENEPGLCAVSGQLCSMGSCACVAGQTVCGSSCVTLGNSCTVGVGVCARTGADICSAGAKTCSATAGTPGTEVCNQLDDDCDGQTDEVGAGLCPAGGQTCSMGVCSCPAGEQVCNGQCKPFSTEVCDGIDNDCNGQIDEMLTITCLADPDGDGYATGAASSAQCPVGSRMSAGFCPVGYVAPANSLGVDCNPTNGTVYRLVSSRNDSDGDSYCVNTASNDCVGAGPLTGRRFAANCNISDDCNDAATSVWQLQSTRADVDTDTYCSGVTMLECIGSAPATGRRLTSTCAATDDCNDATASLWRIQNTRADSDADGYCSGASVAECMGTNPATGRRLTTACAAADDCNDSTATLYRSIALRDDADADQYCANAAVTTCIGAAAPTGKRIATACAGDDCKDNNAFATTTCTIAGGWSLQAATKQCGIGIPGTETFYPGQQSFCPQGFTADPNAYSTTIGGTTGGTCSTNAGFGVTMSCGAIVFGSFSCTTQTNCIAN